MNKAPNALDIPALTPIRRNEKDDYNESSNKQLLKNNLSNRNNSSSPKENEKIEFDYYGSNNKDISAGHFPLINGNNHSINNVKTTLNNLNMNADIHREASVDSIKTFNNGMKVNNGDLPKPLGNSQSITKHNSTLKGKIYDFIVL